MRNAFVGKMIRMFSLFVPPVRHFWSSGTVLVLTSIGVGLEACKGRRPLGEAWLRVRAIIAEFNMGCYGVAR